LTVRQIHIGEAWEHIRQASWGWIALAVALYSSAFLVRSFRWRYLLAPLVLVPGKRLFTFLVLGFFMNNTLPMRLGELIRAHVTAEVRRIAERGAGDRGRGTPL
jgi:uncharacterized membrane protein YbhN (UPF0104 family)